MNRKAKNEPSNEISKNLDSTNIYLNLLIDFLGDKFNASGIVQSMLLLIQEQNKVTLGSTGRILAGNLVS